MKVGLLRVLAFLLASVVAGCDSDRDLGTMTRSLATLQVGNAEIEIAASAAGWHTAAHPAPEFRWVEAADRWYLDTSLIVRRNGEPLPLHTQLDSGEGRVLFNKNEARRELDALAVDSCTDGRARAIWRVRDSSGKAGRGWEVIFVLDRAAVHTTLGKPAENCREALAASLPFEEWLAMEAKDPDILRFAYESGRERDSLRGILRGGLHAQTTVLAGRPRQGQPQVQVDYGPFFETVKQAVTRGSQGKPDLEADLYAVLAPDPRFDSQLWDPFNVRDFLLAAPDPLRKRAFIEQTLTYCQRKDLPRPAAEWRLYGLANVIVSLRDAGLCRRGLDLAGKLLERPGEEYAAAALVLVKELLPCAEGYPRLAELMRAGLSRRSAPDEKLASPDQTAYELVDPDCQDDGMAPQGDWPFRGGLCRSFPRFAGSWLARHCNPAAVAAAKAAIASRKSQDFDPRTDMVLDGALRVLAACDPKAFEEAIAPAPDHARTVSTADATGKENLRRIYLKKRTQ